MSDNIFKTTMDKSAKLLTYGLQILMLASMAFSIGIETEIYTTLGLALLYIVIWFIPLLYSPTAYKLSEGTLEIMRPIGPVRIAIQDIVNLRMAEKDELKSLMRLFASGGLFGYFGKFYDSKHKNFMMYARNRKNKVLIFTKTGLVVLAPDDSENFVQSLRKALINR